MTCPRCHQTVSAFSTKCQSCTADYTVGRLWAVNIGAWLIILGVFLLLGIVL